MATLPRISAYVIAFNEAEKIGAAIESVLWADEIVVVDSHSSDGTPQIAERLGARVVQVDFEGFGKLRNSALEACRGDWIFSLDSDERCTPEVRDEVLSIVASPDALDVYRVPRRNHFMGRWIRHSGWYPNFRQPQLFRRGAMVYTLEPVHEGYRLLTDKPLGELKQAIWQFPFRNLGEVVHKANRYSTLGAAKVGVGKASMPRALASASLGVPEALLRQARTARRLGRLRDCSGLFEQTFYRYAKRYEQDQAWPCAFSGTRMSHREIRVNPTRPTSSTQGC